MECGFPLSLWAFFWHQEQLSDACQDILGDLGPAGGLTFGAYLLAFTLTCLLEAPLYALALNPRRFGLGRFAAVVVLINLCTHPLVVFGLPALLAGKPYAYTIVYGELTAPAVEAAALVFGWGVAWRRALGAAVAANLWSWLVGTWLANAGWV